MSRRASEITIQYGLDAYRGAYRIVGVTVHVTSPYGAASSTLALRTPAELLAELILLGLAQAWVKRRPLPSAQSA